MRTPAAGWRWMAQAERADEGPRRLLEDALTSDVLARPLSECCRLVPWGSATAMPLQPGGDVMAYSCSVSTDHHGIRAFFERTPPAGTCARTPMSCHRKK